MVSFFTRGDKAYFKRASKTDDGHRPIISGKEPLSDDMEWTESDSGSLVSESRLHEDGLEIIYESTANIPEYDTTQNLFKAAQSYLKPGKVFRAVSYLYAERKLFVFFLIHLVATLVVWGHFALTKWKEQTSTVPATAPSYIWKRVVPTLEFGAMHAILITMALIPLTMCRLGISTLSETSLNRFVPFNRTLRMHIHLGYTMILTIVVATIVFFAFFGKMCANGEKKFCNQMTSEIMSTGYGILVSMLIVGFTSFFRHRIPYEIFYIVHHLVFIMYAITIAHTLDHVQRNGERNRSQAFKWFTSTLLLYVCDRVALAMNHRYETRIMSASTVTGSDGSRMILLKVRRPVLFRFKPGQFAHLRVKGIDRVNWHPFSIASGPDSNFLEFYVEVFSNKSWTGKLWDMVSEGESDSLAGAAVLDKIEVMGPYGTSLAKVEDFSHGLVVGTGTGIVPVFSLLKQHVRQLTRLSPEAHMDDLASMHERAVAIEAAESARKGSLFKKVTRGLCGWSTTSPFQQQADCESDPHFRTKGDRVRERLSSSITRQSILEEDGKIKSASSSSKNNFKRSRVHMRDMRSAARVATRSVYGTLAQSFLPAWGVALMGLSLSWNTIKVDLIDGMLSSLQVGTVLYQVCFLFVSLFVWDGNSMLSLVDFVVVLVSPFADWFWYLQYDMGQQLKAPYLTTYCILTGYMLIRMWGAIVEPRKRAWSAGRERESRPLECLELVWVTRSATLVSEIYPEIDKTWTSLVEAWGKEHAEKVCKISIHVTDQNDRAIESLQNELCQSQLYKSGRIHFGRPDFRKVIEDHTLQLVSTRRHSYSVLAFCGSAELSSYIHHCKISNDMITSITGYKNHQMEFVSESYGGSKSKKRVSTVVSNPGAVRRPSMIQRLTSRRHRDFLDGPFKNEALGSF